MGFKETRMTHVKSYESFEYFTLLKKKLNNLIFIKGDVKV